MKTPSLLSCSLAPPVPQLQIPPGTAKFLEVAGLFCYRRQLFSTGRHSQAHSRCSLYQLNLPCHTAINLNHKPKDWGLLQPPEKDCAYSKISEAPYLVRWIMHRSVIEKPREWDQCGKSGWTFAGESTQTGAHCGSRLRRESWFPTGRQEG